MKQLPLPLWHYGLSKSLLNLFDGRKVLVKIMYPQLNML